ncbi:nuclear transport factor 2 family protein [Jeongeupia chitinilytica]|uniref:DUF4440 domain-containing protein n=1 Tax=Jeongeupia chitinilytica TaxID=1041641 RepID=A0ABQ3GZ99_9NEIS|nr:nuclear transport factor 2 family protein [Jeongeupia chitinilytica]GHD61807.1 hypothetical protein GCM10007350_16730 [Jeongeupia chitinilytica]
MHDPVRLVLTGELQPGISPETAAGNLATLLRIDVERARQLLDAAPKIIKPSVSGKETAHYLAHLKRAGVVVRAEPLAPPADAARGQAAISDDLDIASLTVVPVAEPVLENGIACPACGRQQPPRTLCLGCGVDMPRFRSAQAEAARQPQQLVPPVPAPGESSRLPIRLSPGKWLLLALVLVVAAWWFFIGGRTISDEQARAFYADYENALFSRDPKNLCALLADDFQGLSNGRESDKEQACAETVVFFKSIERIGNSMDGILQLDSDINVRSVSVATDKRRAVVRVDSTLDVGGSIMNIRSQSTDTLIRRNGKVLLLRSESVSRIEQLDRMQP